MRLNVRKFNSEMLKLESYLDSNYETSGVSFREKIDSVVGELPKGIVEKLHYLAGLWERSRSGETLTKAELKQAGYWIAASIPYLTNGANLASRWPSRLIWIALACAALFAAYRFLWMK